MRDSDGASWTLDNAKTDGNTVTLATTNPQVTWNVEMKVTTPELSDTSNFKNHGDYVSQQGGGADAAHSCIGVPINSSK